MRRLLRCAALLLAALLAMFGVAGAAASASSHPPAKARAASGPHGSITDLLGAGLFGSWTGFDFSDTTSLSEFASPTVLGALFDLGPNGTLIPDLATGYKLSNGGLTLTIHLRPGLVFSNGDPLDSSVVAYSFKRWISPTTVNGLEFVQDWPMSSVSTPNATTVVVHFTHVFAGILASIPFVVDPVALQKMGEVAYNLKPVGAGPFMVESDKPSAQLVLKANPRYWRKGYPKIETINVLTTGSDESGYEAIQAGQAQLYEGLGTLGLVTQAQKNPQMRLYSIPATGTWALQLNTLRAPLNNKLAREALYYATDAAAINKHVFNDKYSVMESPTGPRGLFYTPTVPGYRTYNLAKAKALVKQLGGLSVTLTGANTPLIQLVNTALQSEWQAAGIKVTLQPEVLATQLTQWKAGNWNIMIIEIGSYDPATGFGLPLYFGATTPFKGVQDPTLNSMLNVAQGTFSKSTRASEYKKIFTYMSNQAYMPFLFAVPSYDIASKDVTGLNSVTQSGFINWATVGLKSGS
jgi:peptide/nickel transport system substrate-binding protein